MRTKRIKVATYILPAYWASVLINADASGYTSDELAEISEFTSTVKPGYCVGCSETEYFAHSNDANNLGGNVLEFYFHTNQK